MYQEKEGRPRTAGASLLLSGAFPLQGGRPCVGLIPPCFCADCEAIRTKAGGRAQPAKISPGRAGAARSRAKAWPGGQRQAPPGGGRGHYRPAPSQGCPRTAPRCAKRSFGEAPLLRYNARLACYLQRDAGGGPDGEAFGFPVGGMESAVPARRRHCGRRVPRRSLGPAPCARRQQSARRPGRGRRSCPKRGRRFVRLQLSKAQSWRGGSQPGGEGGGGARPATEPPDSKRAAPATGPPSCSAVLRSEDWVSPSSIILTRCAKYVNNFLSA